MPNTVRGLRLGLRRAATLTFAVLLAFALCLWANAIVNSYRFNVAIALLGTLPVLALLVRAVVITRTEQAADA